MPDLPYVYMPVYGIDPYLDNGGLGGAKETNDNLVITAWQITDKLNPPPDYLTFGNMLKPAEVNTALPTADRIAGVQAVDSRHSSLAYLNPSLDNISFITVVCFVLRPPPEMKQLLQRSVEYNGGDPLDISNYVVKKSLQSTYMWKPYLAVAESHNNVLEEPLFQLFSTYLFYSEPAAEQALRLPFLKTNGADGATPTFFDVLTPNGVRQMVEAVDDGDFYIAYSMLLTSDVAFYLGTTYPHSIARS